MITGKCKNRVEFLKSQADATAKAVLHFRQHDRRQAQYDHWHGISTGEREIVGSYYFSAS